MHSNRDHRHSHRHDDFGDQSFSEGQRQFRDRKIARGRGSREHRHEGPRHHSNGGQRQYQHKQSRGDGEPRYCSRSEGACAILMQRYIPGFELKEGTTFQIGIGQNHRGHTLTVDFLVSGVLFEYHAVRFWRNSKNWGDFKDYKEYRDYRRELNALPKHERARFTEQTKQLLAQNYYDKKRAFLDTNPDHREKELVVAISPGEFYEKIIRRFGVNVPDKGTFNTEFQKLLSEVVADYEKGQNPANGKKRRKH